MLDLGARLGFEILDFTLGLVDQTALVELGIGAAPGSDLPDHLTTFVLLALLDTGISGVRVHRVFVACSSSATWVTSATFADVP